MDDFRQQQVVAYFALMEAGELLKHNVERQLRRDGDLSYVQFRILAQLADRGGRCRMTDLADGVVYSRAGLTYQAGVLEKSGLVTREPSQTDERSTEVSITKLGTERLTQVVPGHVELVADQLYRELAPDDVAAMADILTRVRDRLRDFAPRSAEGRRGSRPD